MTEQFAIRRKIEIDAAHRVPDHKSKCFNIHGHRYVIEATCSGHLVVSGEQKGMVMDFSFLKSCMMQAIHNPCDHGAIFWREDPMLLKIFRSYDEGYEVKLTDSQGIPVLGSYFLVDGGWKLRVISDVPTAENLARLWYDEVQREINGWFNIHAPDENIPILDEVRVHETPNCVAWYPHYSPPIIDFAEIPVEPTTFVVARHPDVALPEAFGRE